MRDLDTALRQLRRHVSSTPKSRCSRRFGLVREVASSWCRLGLSVAAVAGGRRSLATDCAQMMIDFLAAPMRRRRPPGFDELTAREHEVRSGFAGYNNADVALVFVLSPKPVRNHVSNTFTKHVARPVLCEVRARVAGLGRRGGAAS
jgi:DNA-binding NarL/FixJ family response regulator